MAAQLKYAVHNVRTPRTSADLPAATHDLQWVGNTATLVYGDRDAVLVDTHTTVEQNAALAEWVRSFGRTLTHVYVTHGHGDHLFGVKQIVEAFPGVQALATGPTVEHARTQVAPEVFAAVWEPMFPGQIAQPPVLPSVLNDDAIMLEGHRLEIIEAGHTDTAGTSSVWVPDLRLVVAGDVAYDDTHLYLAETTGQTRQEWIAAVDRLQRLDPLAVVAGHKNPEHPDSAEALDATVAYLRDAEELAAAAKDAGELFTAMLQRHPRRINPGILWMSASSLMATA